MSVNPMIIAGFDPSINETGWGIISNVAPDDSHKVGTVLAYGVISGNPWMNKSPMKNRAGFIERGTFDAIESFTRKHLVRPCHCGIEYADDEVRKGRHWRSLRKLEAATWAIYWALIRYGFTKSEITMMEVKALKRSKRGVVKSKIMTARDMERLYAFPTRKHGEALPDHVTDAINVAHATLADLRIGIARRHGWDVKKQGPRRRSGATT